MDRALRRALVVAVLLVAVGLGLVYTLSAEFRREAGALARLLVEADVSALRDYLRGFGLWAPLASAALQLVTSVLAPLPSFVLAFANALVFGFAWGVALTFSTALLASAVCFGLARSLGRPVVERLASRHALAAVDGFFERHGVFAVLIARLIPFINPDVVSYAAGLTAIRWRWFLLSIAVGSLPSTLLYSYLGAQGVTAVGWLLIPLVGVGLLTLVAAVWRARRAPGAKAAPGRT
jgi:uncharacterized membrane protein YdjX (TVP38/TMEM64 family)